MSYSNRLKFLFNRYLHLMIIILAKEDSLIHLINHFPYDYANDEYVDGHEYGHDGDHAYNHAHDDVHDCDCDHDVYVPKIIIK